MSITTYAELQAAIADTLNRDDLTSAITNFISLAEEKLGQDVDHPKREKRATAAVDGQYSALPSDFYSPIRVHEEGGSELRLMSAHDMVKKRSINTDSGSPLFYCLTGNEMEVYPTPSASTNIEMAYVASIPALSDSNTTNWLLTAAPSAYLYGSLLHSAPYLVEDQRLQVWGAMYDSAIVSLNLQGHRAKWGGTGLVMRAAQ